MATPPPIPGSLQEKEFNAQKCMQEMMEQKIELDMLKAKQEAEQKKYLPKKKKAQAFLDAMLGQWLKENPREPLTQAVVTQLVFDAMAAVDATEKHKGLSLDEAGSVARAGFRSERLAETLPQAAEQPNHKERF